MKWQMPGQQRQRLVGSLFGQIGPTGWEVRGDFGQKCPNSKNFIQTKMGGFRKIWDQTFMGIIRGPIPTDLGVYYIRKFVLGSF